MVGQINIKGGLRSGAERETRDPGFWTRERERSHSRSKVGGREKPGSSRDSNLSTVDRNLHGRVCGIDKILSVPLELLYLLDFPDSMIGTYFLCVRGELILHRLIFVQYKADVIVDRSRAFDKRCNSPAFVEEARGQLFCRRRRAGQKYQTYQRARAQTPPASRRKIMRNKRVNKIKKTRLFVRKFGAQ